MSETVVPHEQPEHSPLGASGAERWLNCPGSVTLIKRLMQLLSIQEGVEEPEWTREGHALHAASAYCLTNRLDAWEIVGQDFHKTEITDHMGQAIQVYLDYCAPYTTDDWDWSVEVRVSSGVHKDFFGTCDFRAVHKRENRVKVVDLKGGAGIMVEAYDNPQLKYYAFPAIEGPGFPPDTVVDIAIVQPRITWTDSPVREWSTTALELRTWVHEVLVPGMWAAEIDTELKAGEWCRFCDAKLVCPMLTDLFGAAARADPARVIGLSDAMLGANWLLIGPVKMYIKALEEEAHRRLSRGADVPGTKLVSKRSTRVLPPAAQALAKERFGDDAWQERELKSAAQLEKTSPAAAAFVKEHAYSPDTGTTVVAETAPGARVVIRPTSEIFKGAIESLTGPAE